MLVRGLSHTGVALRKFCSILLGSIVVGQLVFIQDAAADSVEISNLSDITVPVWITGDPDIIQDVFVCVYRQNTTGTVRTYGIKATGDGPGFFIKSGIKQLPYSVTWNDGGAGNPSGGTTSPLMNNVALSGLNNARNNLDLPANSNDCNAGASPTSRLRLTITSTDMDAATDGTYTGTITLLLSTG